MSLADVRQNGPPGLLGIGVLLLAVRDFKRDSARAQSPASVPETKKGFRRVRSSLAGLHANPGPSGEPAPSPAVSELRNEPGSAGDPTTQTLKKKPVGSHVRGSGGHGVSPALAVRHVVLERR